MYRLSHREKALILGASQDLREAGDRGKIGNGNCVQKSSPAEKGVMEDAESSVPVLSESPQSGQKE